MKQHLVKMLLPGLIALSIACLVLFAARPSVSGGPDMVTPAELKSMLEKNEPIVLIDVRTPQEFAGGHIPGSVSMPVDTLESAELPGGGRIILYCRTGKRSQKAFEILSKGGFTGLSVLEGGLEAWTASGGRAVEGTPPPR